MEVSEWWVIDGVVFACCQPQPDRLSTEVWWGDEGAIGWEINHFFENSNDNVG